MVVFDKLEKLGLRSGPKFVVKFVLILLKFVLFQNSFELQRNYEKTSIVDSEFVTSSLLERRPKV